MMTIGDGRAGGRRAVQAFLLAGFAFSTAVSPLICCPGASAGLPGHSEVAVFSGPALELDVTPRIQDSLSSRSPWLLPFVNGPAAVS